MVKKGTFKAYGEVYNVKERMEDEGLEGDYDPDWYEYEMFLQDPKGNIVAEWDSRVETYNPGQELSKKRAEEAVAEIVRDVEAGNARSWFTIPESRQQRKVAKKSRKLSKTSPSLRSMR